jgi:hypothetical protein
MDINKMLTDLRLERDQVAETIVVLERLLYGQGKRRGRPPKWMTQAKQRGRLTGSKNKQKAPDSEAQWAKYAPARARHEVGG